MPETNETNKPLLGNKLSVLVLAALVLAGLIWLAGSLRPANANSNKIIFEIKTGEGFKDIANGLEEQKLIRSALAAKIYFLITGSAWHLKSGAYLLDGSLNLPRITQTIEKGERQQARVVIPEGSSIYDIDNILSSNFVLKPGEFISLAKSQNLEGRLFPDTYDLFLFSKPEDVVKKMSDNFTLKAVPLLSRDPKNFNKNLILASLLEKEVPEFKDQQVVAGIILKRIAFGMQIQLDATICYIKEQATSLPCYPLNPFDFKLDSPYNTYLHKGLPPGPIGNPGASAIRAAMSPARSAYWFYLSDPKTRKTIFSETLDKHAANRVQYLEK